jgi:hypothetical protein
MFIEKRFDHLTSADAALDTLEAATPRDMGSPGGAVAEATAGMLSIMKQDVANFGIKRGLASLPHQGAPCS